MGILNRVRHHEQPVQVQEKRFGYFPKTFRWRGKRYDVQAIERIWAKSRRMPRLYFRVRCRDGIFDLYQDLRADTWHLCAVRA